MLQQSPIHFNIKFFFSQRDMTKQRQVTMHHEGALCIETSLSKIAILTPKS